MQTMFDAVDPAAIPPSAGIPDYVLGYVDGRWPSLQALRTKYPTAKWAAISTTPNSPASYTAQGCDGESGDYDPDQAAVFAADRLVSYVPFIYCSDSDWPAYQSAVRAIGLDPQQIDWGIAAYPGIGPVLYPGTVFHQFVDYGPYDESVVLDGWIPGRPIHSPTGGPVPVSQALTFKPGQADVFQISGGVLFHKFLRNGGWANEALCGGGSVIAVTRGLVLPDQTPEASVIGNQLTVTAEDGNGKAWYWAQSANANSWGVNELP